MLDFSHTYGMGLVHRLRICSIAELIQLAHPAGTGSGRDVLDVCACFGGHARVLKSRTGAAAVLRIA